MLVVLVTVNSNCINIRKISKRCDRQMDEQTLTVALCLLL